MAIVIAMAVVTSFIVGVTIAKYQFRNIPELRTTSGASLDYPELPEDATNVQIVASIIVKRGASSSFKSSNIKYYVVTEHGNTLYVSDSDFQKLEIGDTAYVFRYDLPTDRATEENTAVVSSVFVGFIAGTLSSILWTIMIFGIDSIVRTAIEYKNRKNDVDTTSWAKFEAGY